MTVIAGTLDLDGLLARLAQTRPVFHSEADFQHAFAWAAHQADPQVQVRLETHPAADIRLDLLLARPDLNACTAIEFKYLTSGWSGTVDGEQFTLKHQSAQDIRGYDVVKDIARLERLTSARPGWNGLFLALCNDASYWRPVSHGRVTNADAFRLYEGVVLAGSRAWGPNTGVGTRKNRDRPIDLAGSYKIEWRDYARLDASRAGTFRSVALEVDWSGPSSPTPCREKPQVVESIKPALGHEAADRGTSLTVRAEILAAVTALSARTADGTFTPREVIDELHRRGTRYADSTIRTHVVSVMCDNAPKHHGRTYDDLERVGVGRYRLRT